MPTSTHLRHIVDRHANDPLAAHRVAFSSGSEQRTFAEVSRNADRVARALEGLGVVRGDRVAVFMGNRVEWVDILFGATTMGAICVPVNVLLTGSDVNAVFADATPKVVVVDALAESPLRALESLPEIVVTVGEVSLPAGVTAVPFADLLTGSDDPGHWDVGGDDPAMMYYTSGTTGRPKAAMHSHAGILWNTLHQVHDLDIGVDESYLVVPSLSWGAGFHDVTLALTWLGGRNELLPTGTATLERIVDLLEEQQFTRTLLVPTLLRDLLGKPELTRRIAGTALRRIMSGAEPLPASVTDPLAEAMPRAAITQTYGMTEFPMIATVIQPEEAVTHAGKAGRPSSVCQLGVADEDGVVRFKGAGEIVTRSPAGFLGYYNRPEENERAFRNGWFHTGDTGFLDDDGFLTVTGRSKDMIITGGLNVYPREIEEVIQRVPGVAEVAVVGIPDERWGETIIAVVVARDDSLTAEVVMERCQQELSKFKCPRRVIISHTNLPKTVTGKILKRQIRLDLAEVAG